MRRKYTFVHALLCCHQRWTGCPKLLLHPKGSSDPQCFREHTHHSWPGTFSWTFMENVGSKMIVHASKILNLLPSLLHLPCPIPPAVTHICQCTCTAVLESFLSAHLNGLTGLRTKDFPILLKESTSQQKQFFSWQFIHQHIAVIQGSHQSTGSFSDRSTVTFQNPSMHCWRGGGFRRENNSKHNLRNYCMLLNLWANSKNVTYSVFSHKITCLKVLISCPYFTEKEEFSSSLETFLWTGD